MIITYAWFFKVIFIFSTNLLGQFLLLLSEQNNLQQYRFKNPTNLVKN